MKKRLELLNGQNGMMFMVGHGDGVDPFLEAMGYKGEPLVKPSVCATIAAKVSRDESGLPIVEDVQIVKK